MKTPFYIIIMSLLAEHSFSQLSPGDIVINEILFNPAKDGYDYIEGHNNSSRPIDLRGLKIASRNAADEISSPRQITHDSIWLPPGGYFVVTANEKWLRQHYYVPMEAIVCTASAMPVFPDDKGVALFISDADVIIDSLSYSEKWHFPLISDPSGVALERISFERPTQDQNNWTSAASSSRYGTPGYKNSEYQDVSAEGDMVSVPRSFSPDNDGINDIALIEYKMKEAGFVMNTIVYDLSGRKVRYLVKNEMVGMRAQYKWDGLDERSAPLPQGIYVVSTEMFSLNGRIKRFRNAIVLAKR